MSNTKRTYPITLNAFILILLAATAYAITVSMDRNTPNITIAPQTPIESVQTGKISPDFTFKDSNGKSRSLKEFKGKIIILNFWASWCPPCIKEFPHFLRAAKEFKDDVIFIAVSSDLNAEAMNTFVNKQKIDAQSANIFTTLDSDQKITKTLFQTYRLPETILIDRAQTMRTKIIGANWDYEDLQKQIEILIQP